MAERKLQDTLNVASAFLIKREGGKEHKVDGGWRVYEDEARKASTGESLPTVGPGLTAKAVKDLEGMKVGDIIDERKITSLFKDTLNTINTELEKEFEGAYKDLSSNEQAAVMSLIYNVGMSNFKHPYTKVNEKGQTVKDTSRTSKAYKALKAGKYEDFKRESFDPTQGFVRSGGQVIKGLQNRRKYELELFNKKGVKNIAISARDEIKKNAANIAFENMERVNKKSDVNIASYEPTEAERVQSEMEELMSRGRAESISKRRKT